MKKARSQSTIKKAAAKSRTTSRTAKKKSPTLSKTKASSAKLAPWQSRWPRSSDLVSWSRCEMDKCYAIADKEEGAWEAHGPIESLAKLGHLAEAFKHLEKFIKRLPATEVRQSTRLAIVGAEICLKANDLVGMENYLTKARAADDRVTRKCDIGIGTREEREFRIHHGLLDPANLDPSAEDYPAAAYSFAEKAMEKARSQKDIRGFRKQLAAMTEAAKLDSWHLNRWWKFREIIALANEVNDTDLIQTLIHSIPAKYRDDVIDYRIYSKIGMKKEAIKAVQRIVNACIDDLLTMELPNIDIPTHKIADALTYLIEQNEKKLAKKLFKKVAESSANWSCVVEGWTTTAVLTYFVPVVEQLEGIEAARELASLAGEHAAVEHRKGWRRGAQSAAMKAGAAVNPLSLDEAIDEARKIRSPALKRRELGRLLAKAGRWKELKQLLSGVASPKEAANIAGYIRYDLKEAQAKQEHNKAPCG